ncbi:hypothetical protein HZA87_04220 [Candidatus Uhrbacteria bacterium]|nr:hypothetical protein [Candidatus Uhrbacteria bacterium]
MKHHYKKSLQQFFKDGVECVKTSRLTQVSLIVSCFFLALTFALPIWRLLPLSSELPFIALHYNIYLGVDQFGSLYSIFWIPALGLFFLVLNLVIQIASFRRQKILSLFFAGSDPLLQCILLLAMLLTILINV